MVSFDGGGHPSSYIETTITYVLSRPTQALNTQTSTVHSVISAIWRLHNMFPAIIHIFLLPLSDMLPFVAVHETITWLRKSYSKYLPCFDFNPWIFSRTLLCNMYTHNNVKHHSFAASQNYEILADLCSVAGEGMDLGLPLYTFLSIGIARVLTQVSRFVVAWLSST